MIDNRKKYSPRKTPYKLYLSDDARLRLERESARTTYPMSMVIDLLVKKHLPVSEKEKA
jgi:hypothetical protein